MTTRPGLAPAELRRTCDPSSLGFATTAELPDLEGIVAQERAVQAIRFAIGVRRDGYNLYALGPEGIGKQTVIRQLVTERAASEPMPDDWCYVHDFSDPRRPRAIRLPAGRGTEFRDDMDHLARELRSVIPAAFETDAFRRRKEALEEELKHRQEEAVKAVEERGRAMGVAVVSSPLGMGIAPLKEGQVIDAEHFRALPQEEQERFKTSMHQISAELSEVVDRVPRWERETRQKVRELEREATELAVDHLINELRARYADVPAVLTYLDAVETDIIGNAPELLASMTPSEETRTLAVLTGAADVPSLRRYRVNLLVGHADDDGAPVVYEPNPNHPNLIGRVEHHAELGALVTDFTHLRAGALHRANGGYLILEARQLLSEPFAWEALKRALRTREIRIEGAGQALGLVTTVTLEPEPIPLEAKLILVGSRPIYYLLCELDPEFQELFKVEADFDDEVPRDEATVAAYARLLATLARRESIRPLDAGGVARLIEYAARLAGDAERLSTRIGMLQDVIREADHYAGDDGHTALTQDDVQRAIDGREARAGRLRSEVMEQIERGLVRVAVEGSVEGQVNGLSVAEVGELSFGFPTRITARIGLGGGEVVDIEREVELGGPIHSKGVMILAGFLTGRYGVGTPLTLRASLVFEQSYGPVEGDSASLAELCALLSALAGVPLDQSLAITGSVDQLGGSQPVGAVNEKIEGFHEVCVRRGLSGSQGVLIPIANLAHLMLRPDVIADVAAGRFHVHAVADVDEALELLTGLQAGLPGPDGAYPPQSLNGRVQARLAALAATAQAFNAPSGPGGAAGRRLSRRSGAGRR